MIRWLAVLLALAACEDSSRRTSRHTDIDGGGAHLVYRLDLAPPDPAALAQAVSTLGARARALVRDADVHALGDDEIVVDLPGVDAAALARARDTLGRSARLELKLADPDAPWMRDLAAEMRVSRPPDLTVEQDYWTTDDGAHDDQYLRGDRGAIERFVATVNPPIPDDRELGYERLDATTCRTYLLEKPARLTGADVASAQVVWDPQTNRPEVQLVFDADGGARFAALTEEAHGRKLAILVDGTVISAPVIQTRIAGGRAQITMGAGTVDEQQRAADQLVANLKGGALPAPLIEVSAELISGATGTRGP